MTLLAIGIYCLLTKRDLIKIVVSSELIAIASSMNFILLASQANRELAQVLMILALSVDTCVNGVLLALLIGVHKKWGTTDVRDISKSEE
jgi:NADH:ubiquinone oxidoreductase subunit K